MTQFIPIVLLTLSFDKGLSEPSNESHSKLSIWKQAKNVELQLQQTATAKAKQLYQKKNSMSDLQIFFFPEKGLHCEYFIEHT